MVASITIIQYPLSSCIRFVFIIVSKCLSCVTFTEDLLVVTILTCILVTR
jgi:hypothetical protein